jgi:hypothetical protein
MNQFVLEIVARLKNLASKPMEGLTKDVKSLGEETKKTTDAKRGLATGIQSVSAAGHRFQRVLNGLKIALGTIAAVLGVGFATRHITAMASSIDALGKASERLEVSSRFLSGFQAAANFTGMAEGSLEVGIRNLRRLTAEYQQGSKSAIEAFNFAGFSPLNMAGEMRSVQDVFADIISAYEKLPDASSRAALAMKVFGTQAGPQMELLLRQGRDGITGLLADAQRLGIVVPQSVATMAAEVNDAVTRVRYSIRGLTIGFFEQYGQAAADVLNRLAGTIAFYRDAIIQFFVGVAQQLIRAIDFILNLPNIIRDVGDLILRTVAYIGEATVNIFKSSVNYIRNQIADLLDDLTFSLNTFQKMILDVIDIPFTEKFLDLNVATKETIKQFANFNLKIGITKKEFTASTVALDKLKESYESLSNKVLSGTPFSDFLDRFRNANPELELFVRRIRDLVQPMEEAGKKAQELSERASFGDLIKSMGAGIQQGFAQYAATLTTVEGMTNRFSSSVSSGFQQMEGAAVQSVKSVILGASSFGDAIKNMGKAWIDTLAEIAARIIVLLPIFLLFNAIAPGILPLIGMSIAAGGAGGGITQSSAPPPPNTMENQRAAAMSFSQFRPPPAAAMASSQPAGMPASTQNTYIINALDPASFNEFLSRPENAQAVSSSLSGQTANPAFRAAVRGAQ